MNNDSLENQTPPQNSDAEKAVLGAIFLDSDALVEAMEYLTPEDFYQRAHQIIFQTMVTLNDEDEAIDVVTMNNRLSAQNQLDDVGGISYIAELAASVPTAANVVYYAKIVQEKAILRRLIKAATKIVTKSYQQDESVGDVLDDAEREISEVSEDRNQSGFKKISDVLTDSMTEINKLYQNGDEITGLSTGYSELDKITAV